MSQQPKKRTLKDRLLKAGPAIGATLGAGYMLAKGKGSLGQRALKAGQGALTGAGIGWLPDIYSEGYKAMKTAGVSVTATQSFWDELEKIAKRGLWDNIHAKRKRIKAGSGEKMRRPGAEGAPSDKALEQSKTAARMPFSQQALRNNTKLIQQSQKTVRSKLSARAAMANAANRRMSLTLKARKALQKTAEVEYRGVTFPGYNKPIPSNRKGKKKMVLVKRGDRVKLVHFGQKGYEDYTQHKDKARRKNYLARSGGIKGKGGKLTANDPFSANYWARKELW